MVMPLPKNVPSVPVRRSGKMRSFWMPSPIQRESPTTEARRPFNPSRVTALMPCTKSRDSVNSM